MTKAPKLTLKTILSTVTQAKINALRVDTLQATDKITSKGMDKNQHKLKQQPPLQSKLKGKPNSNPDRQAQHNTLTPQTEASSTAASQTDKSQGQQPQPQDQGQGQHRRIYRTRKERAAFKERLQVAQQWLQENYPAVFNWDAPKPLKIRIRAELIPQRPKSMSYHQLKDALQAWTHRRVYLQSLLDHDQRYDLDGQPVEEITPEHKDYARQQLEHKQQRFEQQQQRRAEYQNKRKLSRKTRDKPVDNSPEKEES